MGLKLRKREAKQRKEIKFEDLYNNTVFEKADGDKHYLKGSAKETDKHATDGIYAVCLETGVVSQPLMEKDGAFDHLFICRDLSFEI